MEIPVKNRIYSLDLLRGLVMIVMALDHTRDFLHFDAYVHDPLDLQTTSVYLYFTRWITNYCAPVFVFLAGTSVFLQSLRKSKEVLSPFLFKRGLWLMIIEIVVVTFAWTFDFTFPVIILGVIWAIGVSLFLMGFIIRLPYYAILILGLTIVVGHNIFDYIDSTHSGFAWDLIRNGHFAQHTLLPGMDVLIVYPFLPWLGLMMVGYGFGKMYTPDYSPVKRKKFLMVSGSLLIAFFIILRMTNSYGNPTHWSVKNSGLFTVLSFLDVFKYPPSLLYLCITIGPALIFLALFENTNNKITKVLSIYGRVPFLYYILHLYLIHVVCAVIFVVNGHSLTDPAASVFGIPTYFMVVGEGVSLGVVYVIWILIVAALYPCCKWFSEYKKKKGFWWLSYL